MPKPQTDAILGTPVLETIEGKLSLALGAFSPASFLLE
jgi:hypothetical protein